MLNAWALLLGIPVRVRRGADMTDLLSSVIAAHGGLDRWRTVRAIDVTFT